MEFRAPAVPTAGPVSYWPQRAPVFGWLTAKCKNAKQQPNQIPATGRSVGAKLTRSARDGPNLTHPSRGNSIRHYEAGITAAEVAADIASSLAKKAISATVNGAHFDLTLAN